VHVLTTPEGQENRLKIDVEFTHLYIPDHKNNFPHTPPVSLTKELEKKGAGDGGT
tara:strand:+ start:452 stop:616 length:165 start_codon:yes stop_codon:yes gene_type:complete